MRLSWAVAGGGRWVRIVSDAGERGARGKLILGSSTGESVDDRNSRLAIQSNSVNCSVGFA